MLIGLTLSSVAWARSTSSPTTPPTGPSAATTGGTNAQASGPPGAGAFFSGHIRSVTAITEVFGEGQRATAAAVEYDRPVLNSALSKAAFTVTGRTISRVYASTRASKGAGGRNGRFVILELTAPAASTSTPELPSSISLALHQTGSIRTVAGVSYPPVSTAVTSTRISNLIVDDFQQLRYTDPATGLRLDYNLFIPSNYDPHKRYPLVLFMPDASIVGTNPYAPLTQGLGAVVWASPADQAKHPAFVLAPQYTSLIANDDSQTSAYMDVTLRLMQRLTKRYSVDKRRLYATGQSGGCLTAIAMNIKSPKLFAASFLVAGQWDPSTVAPMAKNKLWIVVSQDDAKAYPGMNAITATLEKNGAKVSRAVWDGTSSPAGFKADVAALLKAGPDNNVHYAAFKQGTVIPAGQSTQGAAGHTNTWRVAYTIEGIRDWLFAQHQ